MSASLVGSEMCIRDRHWPVMVCLPTMVHSAVVLQVRGRNGHGQFRLRPVSYTHLTLPTICSV
eukprot:13246084-Alexandrium_andersonii.AAC.1